eukprot:scaffold398_cov305-Prasinococcus_capsulatus_cf.AAC.7
MIDKLKWGGVNEQIDEGKAAFASAMFEATRLYGDHVLRMHQWTLVPFRRHGLSALHAACGVQLRQGWRRAPLVPGALGRTEGRGPEGGCGVRRAAHLAIHLEAG